MKPGKSTIERRMNCSVRENEMQHYACAMLNRDGRILLGKRAPHRKAYPNLWDVIGGKVEAGESVEQALARELGEEIGVAPAVYQKVSELLDTSPNARGTATYHMFSITHWSGLPSLRNNEHTALQWFAIADACSEPDLALEDYRDLFMRLNQTKLD
jgi:8-oxo-dGTP diphosphatase